MLTFLLLELVLFFLSQFLKNLLKLIIILKYTKVYLVLELLFMINS